MPTILDLITEFGIAIIAFLKASGFLSLDGTYDPQDFWREVPLSLKQQYESQSRKKNQSVWSLLKATFVSGALLAGARTVAGKYKLPAPKQFTERDYVQEYYKLHGAELVKGMSAVDASKLKAFIWSNADRAERPTVEALLKEPNLRSIVSESRAALIVTNEKGRAANYGAHYFAEENGARWKRRIGLHRSPWPRPTHRADEAEGWVAFDKPYPHSGEMCPLERDIGCKCRQEVRFSKSRPR